MFDINQDFIRLIEPDSCKFTDCLYEVNHTHTNYEIILCLSGRAEAFINKRDYLLEAGKGILVLPGQIHLYKNLEKGLFCVIVFKPELVPTLKSRLARSLPRAPLFDFYRIEGINDLVVGLKENYTDTQEYAALLCGYVNLLMHYICLHLEFVSVSGEDSRLLDKIVEYCFLHFRQSITVSALAKALLTNSNRISSVFNKCMNMGLPQYVEFIRLSAACDLLKCTSLSILEISEEVGFGTVRSMNRAFSEILGTTPKQFRATHSQGYKIELGGF